jgi:branched-chain amino acid transport system permease protein
MSVDHFFFAAINILLAWSVYVVMMTGALSFAAGAFMAIGCYVSGSLTVHLGWPLYPAWLAGAAVAAVLSVPIGLIALRLRGVYFILATIGVTISTQIILENIEAVGGSTGFGGMMGTTPDDAFIAVAVVGALLAFMSFTPLQRVLDAIREDERVAASMGINVVFVRVAMFAVGAALAGYAGGLYGHYLIFVRPENFDIFMSIYASFYVMLGGVNNFAAPALGAVVLTLLPDYISGLQEWRPTFFGLAIIVILLIFPQGVAPWRAVTARKSARSGR